MIPKRQKAQVNKTQVANVCVHPEYSVDVKDLKKYYNEKCLVFIVICGNNQIWRSWFDANQNGSVVYDFIEQKAMKNSVLFFSGPNSCEFKKREPINMQSDLERFVLELREI